MSDKPPVRYVLGLDISECHTGWALYDRREDTLKYGVIEPPKGMTETVPRIDFAVTEVCKILPGEAATWALNVLVIVEGFAFAANGNRALQLAGVGYGVRYMLWQRQVNYREVTPNQGKKFLTGKHQCDKDLILKEVFKRYRNPDGTPIDVDDDNIADAINMQMIGRTMLEWREPANQAQKDVVAELNKPPAVKGKKSKKKAA